MARRDSLRQPVTGVLSLSLSYASLPQSFFLSARASLASVFRRPHRFLISSSCFSCSALISGAAQHRLMKNCEHSYFSANRYLVHLRGSSFRSFRISSTCSGVMWYFFSYIGRTGFNCDAFGVLVGVAEEAGLAAAATRVCSFLRGSSFGRKSNGVW